MIRTISGEVTAFVLALAILLLAGPAAGQISGRVTDSATQQPVAYAGVALLNGEGEVVAQAVSNEDGRFVVVPRSGAGQFTLQVVALGYVASPDQPVEYQEEGVYLDIQLAPAPIATDGLTVTVDARNPALQTFGFYQREGTGRGIFITPEDLEGRVVTRASELLRRIPSIDVNRNEPLFTRNQGRLDGACLPALYLDGVPIRNPSNPNSLPFEQAMPPAEQILALEAYPGGASVPAQWAGVGTLCGVIVVWTKRR